MNANSDDKTRLVAFVCFIVGATLGLGLAEYFLHSRYFAMILSHWAGPYRGVKYFWMAATCTISMGTLGAALAGFRLLPKECPAETE
jgi:hypothetical protein